MTNPASYSANPSFGPGAPRLYVKEGPPWRQMRAVSCALGHFPPGGTLQRTNIWELTHTLPGDRGLKVVYSYQSEEELAADFKALIQPPHPEN